MVFKDLRFPEAYVWWSWLWCQHRLVTVPVRLSRCRVVKLWISYHPCNGQQTALIKTRWTMQSGASTACESMTLTTSLCASWRSGPDLTRDHQCCSYSEASSSAWRCEGRQRTFWKYRPLIIMCPHICLVAAVRLSTTFYKYLAVELINYVS